jgi:hypothetical protein
VRLASTGVELPKGGWQTVDQLFDYVERSFGDKSRSVRVEYDRGLGYPTLIEVSCPPNIMDCGVTIVIKNLGGLSFLN